MKKTITSAALLLGSLCLARAEWKPAQWPVLKTYDKDHLYNVALPLGGIGTGTVALGGRGELRDWEIMNVPARNYSTILMGNDAPLFAIYVNDNGKKDTRGLIGPVDRAEYMHYEGRPVNHHGVPRFENASFEAAYPFGQVLLSDHNTPVQVRIKGFNPLIPGDAERSGIPMAVLSYQITNPTDRPIEVAVCGSIRNFIGRDGSKNWESWKGDLHPEGAKKNRNAYRVEPGFSGIYFTSEGVDSSSLAWGTLALVTDAPSSKVSYRTASCGNAWADAMLDFWDDFSADGLLNDRWPQTDDDPMASLSVKKTIAPGATESFNFYLTWHFPNREAWSDNNPFVNYYCTTYENAWDVAQQRIPQVPALEADTKKFVDALCNSSLPAVVKEAALFNLPTLRSQTVFRITDGHMMGWEGVMDRHGSCYGSCSHVWNYEVATPFLFGELAMTMRDAEFNYSMNQTGRMNFRIALPLSKAADNVVWAAPAADGQLGCIMKMYREWQLSGNTEALKQYWPKVKLAMSYAWRENSWDANQDGVMEGTQHNTMDVNYHGPNPQMGFWYMGALRASEEMAKAMGDTEFAAKCRNIYELGSAWMDANLFNGEYYEHKITNPKNHNEYMDMSDLGSTALPNYQLGPGCLVDQLVGQYMAHICGLGYLGDEAKIKTTLQSIMKYNYLPSFANVFNNMRSYVMGDESGLIMAGWPKGRLRTPFPYFAESMSGFEYTAAVGMLYEGQTEDGMKCIASIRDRYDGDKRNPFNEPECGHHYARAMASWAAVIALSDFQYSGVKGTMSFTKNPGTYFWSTGYAWGTAQVKPQGKTTVDVLFGSVKIGKKSHAAGDSFSL